MVNWDKSEILHILKQFTRSSILRNKYMLLVIIKWSKTIQFGRRVLKIPLVAIKGSPLCPVSAYNNMCSLVPAPKTAPAFCKRNGKSFRPIIYKELNIKLKKCVEEVGESGHYASHSLRRGGASFAYRTQVPPHLIQVQGDWASDCYKKYIDLSDEQRLSVSQKMGLVINKLQV